MRQIQGTGYSVDEAGSVYNTKTGRRRKVSIGKDGYHRVNLSVDGRVVTRYVHRLVWEAYRGEIVDSLTVNHKDLDKGNNSLDNLELMTQGEQLVHARGLRGNWNNTPTRAVRSLTIGGKRVRRYRSIVSAAKDLGIDSGNICRALKDPAKRSGGFYWEYVN